MIVYWYRPRDKFDDKLMKELENQFKNYTHEIGMSDLEKETEDLKKARFYLNRKIKLLEEEYKQAL